MLFRRDAFIAIALSLALAGCGQSAPSAPALSSECVEIPDGQFFQWVNGRLVGLQSLEDAGEQPPETARRIGATLAAMGYRWINLDWNGRVLTVRGIAPDALSRSDGFNAARTTFEADLVAGGQLQEVRNEITIRDSISAVAGRLNERLAAEGIAWLRVTIIDQVAVLRGNASSAERKRDAYLDARTIINADADASDIVNVVVDAISAPGEPRPVGVEVATLTSEPSLIACENAFFDTMSGRTIQFMGDEAIIDNSSARLLDALSGIAQLCSAYEIEIGRHSQADGDPAVLLELSQRRAGEIRDYMSTYGAVREQLIARGYGNTRPLNGSGSSQNSARTEFTVRSNSD